VSTDKWNPEQYGRFEQQRAQPFWDLAARVDFDGAKSLLDVGCGTGEMTARLHHDRKLKTTLGIDSSSAMLKKAAGLADKGLSFALADVEHYGPPERYDVVFSNAALQWADHHKSLFIKILNWLNPGGQLAIQMPCNFDHASHFLASDVAQEMKLKVRQVPLLAPETYAELLWRHGMDPINVWIQVYLHPLRSGREVVEWTKGTLLTWYEKQLDEPGFKKFLDEYTRRLLLVTGEGAYLYPFKRLFIVGKKRA